MSNYRIIQKQLRIEKTPMRTRRGVVLADQIVTRKQALWRGETLPGPEIVARAIIKKVVQPEEQFDPENLSAWQRRPTVLDEKILVQEQRAPKFLGWKTLQLADIAPPSYEIPEVEMADIPQQSQEPASEQLGLAKRIVAFAMANDPLFKVAKR